MVGERATADQPTEYRSTEYQSTGYQSTGYQSIGYQPVLDGIRAVAVIAVILYHAGFSWMHGGFFGVEVFFVVSGYLITSLLVEEQRKNGSVSLRGFWLRRARRLLPALFTMLAAVALWASFFGDEHLGQLRKDILPAVFYVSNWAQVFGDVPYFSTEAPLLRHLWSLAVEEQWYLLWPLAFIALVKLVDGRIGRSRLPLALMAASVASMVFSILVTLSDSPLVSIAGQEPDRYNFLYLNTLSRASGLLLGASMAFWWRPWTRRSRTRRDGVRPRTTDARDVRAASGVARADVIGLAAMGAIMAISVAMPADILADAALYRLWLPLVTVLSAVAIGAMVDPAARLAHRIFASDALVAIGKRSYGLYLWHWPVFVFADVRGEQIRFIPAIAVTVVVSELCYRYVETPIRERAYRRWWVVAGVMLGRERRTSIAGLYVLAAIVLTGALGARLVTAESHDVARDDSEVAFDQSAIGTTVPTSAVASSIPTASTAVQATSSLPRRIVIVGDSQAHSLAINLPKGIESTFRISDGSVQGCGVLDEGRVISERDSFRRALGDCEGWQEKWADAVRQSSADVALVVIGAWEVFDLEVDGELVKFGSPEGDAVFLEALRSGIDALGAAGAHVALLEVPCMRPRDVDGAGVPALPERGDDERVAHVNELMRRAAADDPARVTFVSGPTQWCSDESIATDLWYRWDGVHVYTPGAKLIYETIATSLLAIPA